MGDVDVEFEPAPLRTHGSWMFCLEQAMNMNGRLLTCAETLNSYDCLAQDGTERAWTGSALYFRHGQKYLLDDIRLCLNVSGIRARMLGHDDGYEIPHGGSLFWMTSSYYQTIRHVFGVETVGDLNDKSYIDIPRGPSGLYPIACKRLKNNGNGMQANVSAAVEPVIILDAFITNNASKTGRYIEFPEEFAYSLLQSRTNP